MVEIGTRTPWFCNSVGECEPTPENGKGSWLLYQILVAIQKKKKKSEETLLHLAFNIPLRQLPGTLIAIVVCLDKADRSSSRHPWPRARGSSAGRPEVDGRG
jgi:hypothetical protein